MRRLVKKGSPADEKRVGPLAHKRCEGRIDLAAGAGVENLDLQPHGAGRRFHVSQRGLGIRSIGRIDEHGQCAWPPGTSSRRSSSRFAVNSLREEIDPREVAARPVEAGDKTEPDRVVADSEDDGDRRGCRLGRECRRGAPVAAITATCRRTRSAANSGSRSY